MNVFEAFNKSDKACIPDGVIVKTFKIKDCIPGHLIKRVDWDPVIEHLTFERIRQECVSGKTLLKDGCGEKLLYLGFNRRGDLVTDTSFHEGASNWSEYEIKDWQISDAEWDGREAIIKRP